ncbi:hypothetical protein FOL47_009292 [Perkinsus chesapeaki]|uniref:Pterin-binding domain-containing protein n=1 Tax=Perkinsus chesapeaki TaxID=330153 RepID=A0A7J6MS35_PERCH|nr:hypothetical protein FOL47_009292 [Perkinsus chesapeaki]
MSSTDSTMASPASSTLKRAYIALGSNMGKRAQNIRQALRLMTADGLGTISDTSFLYQTKAQYVTEQPDFLNCVLSLETELAPHDLLKKLNEIEEKMGRVRTLRYGPRPIDLDILLYGDEVIDYEDLKIPHERIQERDFVLAPLRDVLPSAWRHPIIGQTLGQMTSALPTTMGSCHRVLPIGDDQLLDWDCGKTYIMGVLNVTPDSFSDGGLYNTVDKAVKHARELIEGGADIIDIGGESTRPGTNSFNALDVAEEQRRVLPVIRAIRENFGGSVLLSVDTRNASTARKVVEAGADMINDIWGGLWDPEMWKTVVELEVPYISMHMQPHGKEKYEHGVVWEVREALTEQINDAMKAGIPRWDIVADVGLGFGKFANHNFQLLRHYNDALPATLSGAPWPSLSGPSRKRFVTDRSNPPEDIWDLAAFGTSAAVVASIEKGASMVRVHDVKRIQRVCMIADKIYRVPDEEIENA